jgi:hypothetical protein
MQVPVQETNRQATKEPDAAMKPPARNGGSAAENSTTTRGIQSRSMKLPRVVAENSLEQERVRSRMQNLWPWEAAGSPTKSSSSTSSALDPVPSAGSTAQDVTEFVQDDAALRVHVVDHLQISSTLSDPTACHCPAKECMQA